MHLELVTAVSFGPFTNAELKLAPGLNVVWGPNEAGKSTWHAAIVMAFTGQRRNWGPRNSEKEFKARHYPWNSDQWSVRALIRRADDLLLEVDLNLETKKGSVFDRQLNRELTRDFLNDGGVDLSQLTGLDRTTFAATACVRQTDLLDVVEHADALQEHMGRAASAAGTGQTASTAVRAIDEFRKEHVGTIRVGGIRPLSRALAAVEAATQELQQAEDHHAASADLANTVRNLENKAEQLAHLVTLFDLARHFVAAQIKLRSAQKQQLELETLGKEIDRHTGSESALEHRIHVLDLAIDARRAIDAANHYRDLVDAIRRLEDEVKGARSARDAVDAELAQLRGAEAKFEREALAQKVEQVRRLARSLEANGDVPAPDQVQAVRDAIATWKRRPEHIELTGRTAEELREELESLPQEPAGDTEVHYSVGECEGAHSRAKLLVEADRGTEAPPATDQNSANSSTPGSGSRDERSTNPLLLSGLVAAIITPVLAIVHSPVAGAAAGLVAALLIALGLRRRAADIRQRTNRMRSLKLEGDAQEAANRLIAAIHERFPTCPSGDASTMFASYQEFCRNNDAQKRQSDRRPELEANLADRTSLERQAQSNSQQREEADDLVATTAAGIGVGAAGKEAVSHLEKWLKNAEDNQAAARTARDNKVRLDQLLNGQELSDWLQQAEEQLAQLDTEADGVGVTSANTLEDIPDLRRSAEKRRQKTAGTVTMLQTQLDDRRRKLPEIEPPATATQEAIQALRDAIEASRFDVEDVDPSDLPDAQQLADVRESANEALGHTRAQLSEAQGRLEAYRANLPDLETLERKVQATLEALEEERRAHPHLADHVDPTALPAEDDLVGQHQEFLKEQDEIVRKAAETRGRLEGQTAEHLDVPAAKERLHEAEAELERVRRLEHILDQTETFLGAATDRVHRNIAPLLRKSVENWLPRIFEGRYSNVSVDPQSLNVSIGGQNSPLKPVSLLSHGTAEQVYLLLRVALVDHLTNHEEPCPLILDEVTVHADDSRADGILELLRELGEKRQIILFSQETRVREWAEQHLGGERHRLELLPGPTSR